MIYVLIDKITKEVKGICENNTAQIEEGMELIILDENIKNLESLGYSPAGYCKLIDNKFVIDAERIDIERTKNIKKIQDKQSGKNKLKDLGLTYDEIDALFL